jgi:hypothetical protein
MMEGRMDTMQEIFAGAQAPLFEEADADALALIAGADEATIAACFEAADADRLEFLAGLLEAAAQGPLSAQQQVALEGLRDFVRKKLAPGTKMVFGKVVKVGKAAGHAAVTTGRAAVAAKRGVQAHAFRFTQAGKQARTAAKRIRDTHGRAASQASYAAAKGTYQAASRAGETHRYAAAQAAKAQAGTDLRARAAEYGSDRAAPRKKRSAAAAPTDREQAATKATGGKGKASGRRARRVEDMDTIFRGMTEGDTVDGKEVG